MDAKTIERWIKSLGLPYSTLIARGIIPDQPLTELYSGRDWLTMKPENGVELSFRADTRCFERLFITLIRTVDDQTVYHGELTQHMAPMMTQSGVRTTFGTPSETGGPRRIPILGMVGGHDAYPLETAMNPHGRIVFQYAADMRVKTLLFALMDPLDE